MITTNYKVDFLKKVANDLRRKDQLRGIYPLYMNLAQYFPEEITELNRAYNEIAGTNLTYGMSSAGRKAKTITDSIISTPGAYGDDCATCDKHEQAAETAAVETMVRFRSKEEVEGHYLERFKKGPKALEAMQVYANEMGFDVPEGRCGIKCMSKILFENQR